MRTDCTIDNVKVRCPNAAHGGFQKWFCKRHDLISYNGGFGHRQLARSLGRLRADGEVYILALVLASEGTFCYERWIDPLDVISINDPPTEFARWFFAKKLPAPDIARKLDEGGTLSQTHISHVKQRVAAMKAGLNAYQSTSYNDDGSVRSAS